jgi:beta-galactosidase GanA
VPDGSGAGRELLSTLSDANRNADARAFAALMRHLRGFDGSAHTVLMIQVENEVGILGDSRDRSAAANSAFAAPVPAALMDYLGEHRDALLPELRTLWDGAGGKASGSWQEVFGPGLATDEIFMAWNYARYVGYVAAAGKAEYALPMYANAWLRQPYFPTPGTYPSGGPQAELMDVWHAGAPAIDILAPDLYGPNFTEWCFKYRREGNPLFLPETEPGPEAGARVFYVLGAHEGLGFSPFGIDGPAERLGPDLAQSYAILSQVAPLILESRGLARMTGFSLDKDHPTASATFGGYSLEIALDSIFGRTAAKGYGMIVATGPGEFVGAGRGFMVRFKPIRGLPLAGLGRIEEGSYRDGRWVAGRRLNGDETDQGGHWRFPTWSLSIERCTVYQFR